MVVYKDKTCTTQNLHTFVRQNYEKRSRSFPFNAKCYFIKNEYIFLDHPEFRNLCGACKEYNLKFGLLSNN